MVTGAGRGIGEAVARAFVEEGAAVVIAERDAATGESRPTGLRARARAPNSSHCDVAEPASAQAAVAFARDRFGRLDIVVNNAGVNVFHPPLETSAEEWRRCFAIDLEGAWHVSKAALPSMIAAGSGAIINIASAHAFSIIPGCFPYPVAKHGLLGLTRALGIEYAANGIRVNAIAPGYIETQIARRLLGDLPGS